MYKVYGLTNDYRKDLDCEWAEVIDRLTPTKDPYSVETVDVGIFLVNVPIHMSRVEHMRHQYLVIEDNTKTVFVLSGTSIGAAVFTSYAGAIAWVKENSEEFTVEEGYAEDTWKLEVDGWHASLQELEALDG